MKALLLALLVTGAIIARGDDTATNLLKNGDFSGGLNHWEGDCQAIDNSSFDPSETAPTAGVIVKLQGSSWTKVSQDFDAKIGEYIVSITYGLSSDLKFSDSVEDYNNISGKLGFNGLKPFGAPPGRWIVLINDWAAGHSTFARISPKLGLNGPQTVTVPIHIDSDAETKGFFLLFPPSTGFINLLNVSLTPVSSGNANP